MRFGGKHRSKTSFESSALSPPGNREKTPASANANDIYNRYESPPEMSTPRLRLRTWVREETNHFKMTQESTTVVPSKAARRKKIEDRQRMWLGPLLVLMVLVPPEVSRLRMPRRLPMLGGVVFAVWAVYPRSGLDSRTFTAALSPHHSRTVGLGVRRVHQRRCIYSGAVCLVVRCDR